MAACGATPARRNRTTAVLEEVVFADCDVESSAEGTAFGGAMMLTFADVTLDDSLVFDADATGDNASGGAAFVFRDSVLRSSGTAFAQNSAEVRGGALQVNNSRIEIDGALFLDNDVTPGENEPIQRAEAIVTLFPATTGEFDVTGFLRSSLFSDNGGLPIFDIDRTSPPFSEVTFDDNDFHSPVLGELVYKNLASDQGVGGMTAAELNNLVIRRDGGGTTRKSSGGNRRLGARPEVGHLVAAPSNVRTNGAVGEGQTPGASVGYAWNGPSARLEGSALTNTNLTDKAGLETIPRRGRADLLVDGERRGRQVIGEERCGGSGVMCLNQERFLVEMAWRDFAGNAGDAAVVSGGSDDSGLFFFFTEDNWEVLVKVLNGCALTDHFWVFAAATTNVEYSLRVTDTVTGFTKSYFNALGSAAVAITDTEALAACDGGGRSATRRTSGIAAVPGETLAPIGKMDCEASPSEMCLNADRFRLDVEWRDFQDNSGVAQVVPLRSEDSGLFFFFTEDNWEMLVKVLDACGVNGNFWVFAAATTNVEYTLTVTDTQTGERRRYRNPLGRAAAAVTDTEAFATCP